MRTTTWTSANSVFTISTAKKSRMLNVIGAASAAVVAAIGVGAAQGQTTLFNDNNTTTTGLQTGGTWNAAAKIWSPASTGASTTTQTSWAPEAIASFGATGTITLADQEDIGGINITTGGLTITPNSGSSAFTSLQTTLNINGTSNSKQIIGVPWVGGYDIAYNYNPGTTTTTATGGTLDLVSLQNWTGNLIVNNTNSPGAHSLTANGAVVQLNSTLGNPSAVIKLSDFAGLGTDNAATFNSVPTLTQFSLANNIIANYNAVNNASVELYQANGSTTAQEIETYAGVISSPSGVTTNVVFGFNLNQGRGTTVLGNHNTYNGNTTIIMSGVSTADNGLLQMGIDNALPATTVLSFGLSSVNTAIAPMDLNGHSQTIAGLATGTTANTANEGNIYNTFPVGGQETPVTLTIAGAANTTYKGDIGETFLNVHPFSDNAPYFVSGATTVAAGTNISLVINGPGSLTLAPVSSLLAAPSSTNVGTNEYTGTTTINGGSLIFGRVGTLVNGQPGQNYTIAGGGAVNVNAGGTLASVSTSGGSYAGGASGTITLNSGAALTIGGANGAGILSTGNVNVNSGSAMNFEISSASVFDQLFVNGTLTLDSTGTHTINFGMVTGGTLTPGIYTLINATGGISGLLADNSNGFVLGSTTLGGDNLQLVTTSNSLQIDILAPALRWDPTAAVANNMTVQEGGGTWQTGSPFADLSNNTEASWDNSTNKPVIIGNDASGNNGAGGDITLGENITVSGLLTFGPIVPGFGYRIAPSGSFSLTLGGGINVNNTAFTGSFPSAEIDTPIVLSANQTWEVDPGQVLDIQGAVNGGTFALTKTGSGTVSIDSGGGSLGSLNVNAGLVILGAVDSIGTTAPIAINGGSVEFSLNGTPSNSVTVGSNGGGIGATTGSNVTFAGAINATGNTVSIIGAGNTTLTGGVTAGTLSNTGTGNNSITGNLAATAVKVSGTGGTLTLSGNNTIGSITITAGNILANSAGALGAATVTFNGGGVTLGPTVQSISNTLVGVATGTNPGTAGLADVVYFTNLNSTFSGAFAGTGDLHIGETPGGTLTLNGLSQRVTGGALYISDAYTAVLASANPLGGSTLGIDVSSTIDVEYLDAPVSIGALRSGNNAITVHKTGLGTLLLNNSTATPSITGSAMVIDQGAVELTSSLSLGGTVAAPLDVTANASTAFIADWNNGNRSGLMVLNSASLIRADNVAGEGETGILGNTPRDQIIANGNSSIEMSDVSHTFGTTVTFGITNPILVTTGSTLTIRNDDPLGDNNTDLIGIRGPTAVTGTSATLFYDLTIQAGATVQQIGTGEVRFGRTNSQGLPIIGQGTPGAEAVLKLGADAFMTDKLANNNVITGFVVNGSGNAGLRIEAAMNATYFDPAGLTSTAQSIGSTGLFGTDTFAGTNTNGDVFTVLSSTRAAALSTNYSDGTNTFTQAGTLTLAANNIAGATGAAITAGPAAASNVTLALDNTTNSGNLVYQIAGGATFGNFAGLVVERTQNLTSSVTARITGPTQISTVTLSNGTSLDMASSMAVTGMTADSIRALITAGYNGGAWNGVGINSSAAAADATHVSAVGYGVPADVGITTLGSMAITGNPIIVKYTYDGDGSLDGKVDLGNDFVLFLAGYLNPGLLNTSDMWELGDYNYDGVVDNTDFGLFIDGFKQQGGSLGELEGVIESNASLSTAQRASLLSVVPEPSTFGLLTAGAGLLAARRRRR